MDPSEVLHIIRNPHGWSEEDVRAARLAAADRIEAQERFIAFLQDALKREMEGHDATHTTMRTAVEALLTRQASPAVRRDSPAAGTE